MSTVTGEKPLEEQHSSASAHIPGLLALQQLSKQPMEHLDSISRHQARHWVPTHTKARSRSAVKVCREEMENKGADLDLLMERLSFFSSCFMWLMQEL